MNEHDRYEINRAALLRQIGISGATALAGIVAVDEAADAGNKQQKPFNLDVSSSGRDTAHRAPRKKRAATDPVPMKVKEIQVASDPNLITLADPYVVYYVPTPYITGKDEDGNDHRDNGKKKKMDGYFVGIKTT